MERSGHKLLACTGFAGHEHCPVMRRHAANSRKKIPHRGTAPHHSFELRILKNAIVDRCGAFTAAPFRIASTADSLV